MSFPSICYEFLIGDRYGLLLMNTQIFTLIYRMVNSLNRLMKEYYAIAFRISFLTLEDSLNMLFLSFMQALKALKQMSQQFVFDLTKSDLAYYYKQSIDGIEEAKKESWKLNQDNNISVREKLSALKLIIEANEAWFKLLSEGPSVLAIRWLEERMNRLASEAKREDH